MSANLKGSRVGLIHVIDPTRRALPAIFANFQIRKFSATMAFELSVSALGSTIAVLARL